MTSQSVQAVQATPSAGPDWLWTWSGVSFGYRLGDSLFTHDGIEVGRFIGLEVYGVDGRYLGEVGTAEDGSRLITNLHKKSLAMDDFVPTFDTAYKRLANRAGLGPLFCGHEDFPSPETARRMVFAA
jgi:hypothetical protein